MHAVPIIITKLATVCIRAQYSLSYTEGFTCTMDELAINKLKKKPRYYTK